MAVNTVTALTISSTISNGEFQALGAYIAAVLDAGGFTRTTDSGQINWGSVAFPGTNNSDAGYEIREMTDSLAGTAPIVVKLNYGRGNGTAAMRVGITIGVGSNGSGTITGQQMTETYFQLFDQANTDWCLSLAAGTNYFCLYGYRSTPNQARGWLLSLERTAAADRTPNSNGCLFFWTNPQLASPQYSRYIPRTGVVPAAEIQVALSIWDCTPPTQQTTGLHGSGDVSVYPIYCMGIGEKPQPSLNLIGGFYNNFTGLNEYAVSVRGVNQNMKMALAASLQAPARCGVPSNTVFNVLMRYE